MKSEKHTESKERCACMHCNIMRDIRIQAELDMDAGKKSYVITEHGRVPCSPRCLAACGFKDRQVVQGEDFDRLIEYADKQSKENAERQAMLESIFDDISKLLAADEEVKH